MLHTIHNDVLTVTVSQNGAQLQSILSRDGTQYLWQGNRAYWSDRALNLFPYVARLTQGSYYMDGQLYHMNIHGIAPYRRFRPVLQEPDGLTLELSSDDQTRAVYPREFVFQIGYRLSGDTLRITYRVENRDSRPMYFGLGGHPGFNVPLAPGKTFQDYRLRFAEPCEPLRVGFTSECFLSGADTQFPLEDGVMLPLRHDLFDQDAIVLKGVPREVTLEAPGDPHAVTVRFPQMPYLGLWHVPKTDAPYICIEPWCSLPSVQGRIAVLEEQEDLICLPADQVYQNFWCIQIHAPLAPASSHPML